MSSTPSTLPPTHTTLHTAHCTTHTAHCTLHTAHCTLHTAHKNILTHKIISHTKIFSLTNILTHIHGWVTNFRQEVSSHSHSMTYIYISLDMHVLHSCSFTHHTSQPQRHSF